MKIKYAKLENGGPVLAPDKIKLNGRMYTGRIPENVYAEAGYFPIVATVQPANTVEDGWQIVDGTIQKKYREHTPEEQQEISRMAILSGDEAEAYYHMEETIQNAQDAAHEAQAAAEEAQQEAQAARADAAAANEAKEAAEAALADTADVIEKIEEVFG